MKKAKPGYKLVKSLFGKYEEIPEDWEIMKLRNIVKKEKFSIVDGPFGTQLHSEDYVKSGVPLMNVGNITKDGKFNPNNIIYISEEKFKELERSKIIPGDIILAKTGATIGKVTIFPDIWKKGLVSSRCAKISINHEIANTEFIYFILFSKFGYSQIISRATATTMPGINLTDISELKIILSKNVKEQQKIADVLSNVDVLIEKYDDVLETTKKLKTGLMQQLLTRGIGHKKFKKVKSLFGKEIEIPEEWKLTKCGDLFRLEYGEGLIESNRSNKGFPVYGSGGIIGYHFKFLVKGPSLIIARKGSLGNIYFEKNNSFPIDTVYYISQEQTKENLQFLYYLIGDLKLENYKIATAQPGINRDDVYSIEIRHPPISEQQKIASIINNVYYKINDLESKKFHLEKLKKGLMQKLLTGEIRVQTCQ